MRAPSLYEMTRLADAYAPGVHVVASDDCKQLEIALATNGKVAAFIGYCGITRRFAIVPVKRGEYKDTSA